MSGVNPYGAGAQQGPPANVNVQQMADLVAAISNSVRALANIAQALQSSIGPNGFSKPVQLASYTVATLPAITLGNVGQIAFATNGRNAGQGAGLGTGCTVQVQNLGGTATWCAIYNGTIVLA